MKIILRNPSAERVREGLGSSRNCNQEKFQFCRGMTIGVYNGNPQFNNHW